MRTQPGVVIGTVVSTDDPRGEGRIQISFPTLPDMREHPWAPLAVPLAGGGRGAWFMPERGDEVLVAFEHGDFDHPFVVGFLWNGADCPPTDGIDASVRRLRTVSGHVIDFDDRGGSERVLIKTQGGHEIEMKDAAPASVHVKTTGGQEVALKDAPSEITVKTTGGQEIDLKDVPPTITLKTAGGAQIVITGTPPGITISMAGSSVSMGPAGMVLNTSTMLSVTAPMLNVTAPLAVFSGVVQVPVLIAEAVVGDAYKPAPGNILGL